MPEISKIVHRERTRFDRAKLEELVLIMGEPAAEDLFGRAMEQIAVAINRVERAKRNDDEPALMAAANSIAVLADQLGLSTLSAAATAVLGTAERGDAVALGATTARLIRVGEGSLLSVWEIGDFSL